MPRMPLIAGNWKMNLNLGQMRELIAGIRIGLGTLGPAVTQVETAICPPAPYLFPCAKAIDGSPIALGAQNVYFESAGAFTGEIAPAMLVEAGVKYVILGHSERRHTIGHLESDWMIHCKLAACMAARMTPILCVGETLAERDANRTLDVLSYQTLAGVGRSQIASGKQLVVAYEPVWAIGTGRNATASQAQDAHAHIRGELRRAIGAVADEVRILYGGSLKPDNARELLSQPDVDGGLVGGASLKADSFVGIVRGALAGAA